MHLQSCHKNHYKTFIVPLIHNSKQTADTAISQRNNTENEMSGGSMDYLYCKLENDANFRLTTPERKAFAKHLVKVAKALHDIEWVDSGDYGPGDESEAIRDCLAPGMVLEAAIDAAHEAAKELREELERACSGARK